MFSLKNAALISLLKASTARMLLENLVYANRGLKQNIVNDMLLWMSKDLPRSPQPVDFLKRDIAMSERATRNIDGLKEYTFRARAANYVLQKYFAQDDTFELPPGSTEDSLYQDAIVLWVSFAHRFKNYGDDVDRYVVFIAKQEYHEISFLDNPEQFLEVLEPITEFSVIQTLTSAIDPKERRTKFDFSRRRMSLELFNYIRDTLFNYYEDRDEHFYEFQMPYELTIDVQDKTHHKIPYKMLLFSYSNNELIADILLEYTPENKQIKATRTIMLSDMYWEHTAPSTDSVLPLISSNACLACGSETNTLQTCSTCLVGNYCNDECFTCKVCSCI